MLPGDLVFIRDPASDDLYISGIPANASEVKVVNVIGKTVLEFDNYENQIKADISKLPAGVYFVNVTTGSKNMVKKFIKD